MNYEEFINKKRHKKIEQGIDQFKIKDSLFDYQKKVSEYAIKKGRCAVFLDTGLGKTLIELTVADSYRRKLNKPVLIITPLAVAFQFIKEAEKFDFDDIQYSKDGKYNSSIVVCNYERLEKFDFREFCCVILDESSILKNYDGKIKSKITSFIKKIDYRFLFTATPSPNDFIELGTSSEALGFMGYTDMLGKYFINNEDTIKPQNIGTKWRLKGHAKDDFFSWVSSWSISMRKPSDLGYSDELHVLPELIENYHPVQNKENLIVNGQIQLFNQIAKTMSEIKSEERLTITERCEKAVELSCNYDTSVYWCNYNKEGDLLQELDSDAVQIMGSMNLDKKEDILLSFADGKIKKLITKAKMTAFGLNWQHCNHTVYFPTFSYEQYYQSIRRFWRFGQKKQVVVDLVYSDGQKRVLDSLLEKSKKANELFNRLNYSLNNFTEEKIETIQITKPKFI